MKITEQVYHDKDSGKEADIVSVTNEIESIGDVFEVMKDLVGRFNDGWTDFKVQKEYEMGSMREFIVISFLKGREWKYIKLVMEGHNVE